MRNEFFIDYLKMVIDTNIAYNAIDRAFLATHRTKDETQMIVLSGISARHEIIERSKEQLKIEEAR